jgi:hypothetical protein
MNSAFRTAIPDSSLAAIGQLSGNSRLGFANRNPALHRGIEWSKSTLALGLPEWSGKTVSDPAVAANNNPCANATLSAAGVNTQQQITTAQGYIAAGQIGASATPYPNPITSFLAECTGITMPSKQAGQTTSKTYRGIVVKIQLMLMLEI